jgi:hypothetical protein
MKLAKITALAALAAFALVPAACVAIALPGQDPMSETRQNQPNDTQFGLPGQKMASQNANWEIGLLGKVIKRGLQVVAGISVVALVWAGVLYLTSYGDEEKVKKAKKAIIWTVLGLVTGLGGWAIVDLINNLTLTR